MSWFSRKKRPDAAAVREASPLVIDLAKGFFDLLLNVAPNFSRAFYRFDVQPGAFGGKASYESAQGVFLIDSLENSEALRALGRMGHELIKTLGKDAGVGLLTVNSKFEYEIQYEWNDLGRWKITKLDGATGIPEGVDLKL